MTTTSPHPAADLLPGAPSVAACPCCGSYTDSALALAQAPALLAVCDVLVIRALEAVGKRIVRRDRARFRTLGTRPWHQAHTIWQPTAVDLQGLAGAWDVVPAMLSNHGCCGVTAGQVERMVDKYVRDLLVTSTPHSVTELRYRFERFLGIDLPELEPYEPGRDAP